jgi:EpsI family protein
MGLRILTVLLILGAAGFAGRRLEAGRVAPGQFPDWTQVAPGFDSWRSRELPLPEEIERVLGADSYLYRDYRNPDGGTVNLFVAYFADQRVGSQIHSPRNCLPGGGWRIQSLDRVTLALRDGPRPVQEMHIAKQGRRAEVLYWFRTRGGILTGEYALKIDLVKNSLAGRPTDAAFVRLVYSQGTRTDAADLLPRLAAGVDAALAVAGLE